MNTREIEQLRKKFIRIAMLAIFLAMFFLGAAINLTSYFTSRVSIRRTLDNLVAYSDNIDLVFADEEEEDLFAAKGVGVLRAFSSILNRYRHFYVISYDADGEATVIENSDPNFSEDGEDDTYLTYAEKARTRGWTYGRFGAYFYKVSESEDGSAVIAFVDCVSEMHAMTRMLSITFVVGLIGMLITYFLVKHFSARAIRPEIENSMRQKRFITNASHELKTPLAVIRANTELTEMMNGESEWTKSTLAQVDRMNGLIQNLVMITRAAEQEDRTELVSIDLSKIVNESVDPFEAMARQENLKMVRKIDKNVTMTADESKIRQLASLLVDNAIKYCDKDGEIVISLSAIKKGKGAQLSVSNHYAEGKNVDYNKFFDRFYREDQSHNIDKGGYGIGLSIAESICRQYNGSIRAMWSNGVITFVCQLKA